MATDYKQRIFHFGLCVLFYMTFTLEAARSWSRNSERNFDRLNGRVQSDRNGYRMQGRAYTRGSDRYIYGPTQKSEKANIIFILTDDQDELLGSMTTMTKTLKYLGSEGVRFNNSFVSTPMCCPSRSSILTGMYPHNHNVYTNNENCSGIEWQKRHEPRTFAKYLSDAGYRTGFFGKYLNKYNGTYVPPGWREWVGLVRNSRFYNYTLNFNGQKVKHDDNYYQDYFTDLIANDSVTFLKQSKKHFPTKPVMMMLSVPAPHGPEDSAPQYQHMFQNNQLHRTPSWNYMNNTNKQTLLREMKPLEPIAVKFIDVLQQKRLQTLQSVDSLVEKVYNELRFLGELENTYIIYTSDHGYHLGQFGVVKGKALPYDFDIRVPLYIRGPGIGRNTVISNPVVNIDLAPTILDMAGITIPEHMDGRSLLKLTRNSRYINSVERNIYVETKRPWRQTVLLERGKVSGKFWKVLEREKDKMFLEDYQEEMMPFANPKLRKTLRICKDPENEPPCKHLQKWVCFRDERNRQRVKKCRNYNKTVAIETDDIVADQPVQLPANQKPVQLSANQNKRKCVCGTNRRSSLNAREETVQRDFLRTYVRKDFKPKFIRKKRNLRSTYAKEQLLLQESLIAQQLELNRQRCRFYPNDTFTCDQELLHNPAKWDKHKLRLDEMIEETRRRLKNLKKIRKNMKKQQKHRKNHEYDTPDSESVYPGHGTNSDYNVEEEELCDCDEESTTYNYDNGFETYGNEFDMDDSTEEDEFYSDYLGNRKAKKCNHSNMKCTTQTNDQWRTPPYWRESDEDKIETLSPLGFHRLRNHPYCKIRGLECKMMDNTHWKTVPRWTYGPFCYCTNSNSNVYWCLRTVNETHNFLYCEFINNFMSFYDFNTDPYQLHNAIKDINLGVLRQLHEDLVELRRCQGPKQCSKRSASVKKDNSVKRERDRRRRRRKVRIHRKSNLSLTRHDPSLKRHTVPENS